MNITLIDTSSYIKLNGGNLGIGIYTTQEVLREMKRKGLKTEELKTINEYNKFNSIDVIKGIKETYRTIIKKFYGLKDPLSPEDISLAIETIGQAKKGNNVVLYTEDNVLKETIETILENGYSDCKNLISVESIKKIQK